jgi:3-deoxy-manno-octulosonate cytidylyltransferase (CMP-KDO synthetase)
MSVTNSEFTTERMLTVVPARYGSSRFPGKPLADLFGMPMVQHVVERIKESELADGSYCVATDDDRIQEALVPYNTPTVMTRVDHPSGSDRLWEALNQHDVSAYDWVVNVQGDEPFISAEHLNTLLHTAATHASQADIVTLITPYFGDGAPATLEDAQQQLNDKNKVKALFTPGGRVLYFSRLPIPCVRDGLSLQVHCQTDSGVYYRHLGVYAYKVSALKRFVEAGDSRLENLEKLEQLRALELGMNIFAGVVETAPVGVDTPEDLEALRATHPPLLH